MLKRLETLRVALSSSQSGRAEGPEHVWFAMPLLDLSAIPRVQMHYILCIYIYIYLGKL